MKPSQLKCSLLKTCVFKKLQNSTVPTFSPGPLKPTSPNATPGQKGEIQPQACKFSPDIAPVWLFSRLGSRVCALTLIHGLCIKYLPHYMSSQGQSIARATEAEDALHPGNLQPS